MIYFELFIRLRNPRPPQQNPWIKYNREFWAESPGGIEEQIARVDAEAVGTIMEKSGLETKITRIVLETGDNPPV